MGTFEAVRENTRLSREVLHGFEVSPRQPRGTNFSLQGKKAKEGQRLRILERFQLPIPSGHFFHLSFKKEPHVKTDGARARHCLPENQLGWITDSYTTEAPRRDRSKEPERGNLNNLHPFSFTSSAWTFISGTPLIGQEA